MREESPARIVELRELAILPRGPARTLAITELASQQRGVVSRAQLLALGVASSAIARHVKAGLLEPAHAGVYRFGRAGELPLSAEIAALLACGSAVALGDWSGAWLWAMLKDRPASVSVVVTVGCRVRRDGIRSREWNGDPGRELRWRAGLPVTSPARTLLDLAAVAPAATLEQALAAAERRRLANRGELGRMLAAHPHARGRRRLLDLLNREEGPAFSRSRFERRLLLLTRAAGLPAPLANRRVAGYEVDLHWPQQRIVVEADGYAFHSQRAAFETDRARDARLASEGWVVLRFTWQQLLNDSHQVVARLAATLAGRARVADR